MIKAFMFTIGLILCISAADANGWQIIIQAAAGLSLMLVSGIPEIGGK